MSTLPPVPDGYALHEGVPRVDDFVRLRDVAGMGPRSHEAAERGLPNTYYGVYVTDDAGCPVGLARVISDGGTVYHISDVAVDEAHQGNGLGTAMMNAVMAFIDRDAPETAYVNLLADIDGFYERWGFEDSVPESKGMVWQPT